MGWKDSAVAVSESPGSSWKDKAISVPGESAPSVHEESSTLDKIKNNLGENLKSVDAFATGAGNTMTINYLPQIESGMGTAGDAVKDLVTKGTVGSWDDIKQNYQQNKDRALAHQEMLQNDRPLAYGAGSVGGLFSAPVGLAVKGAAMVPTAAARIIPGATAAAEAFPTLAKFIKAGSTAGVLGLAANPGDTKGQSGDPQIEQRLTSGAIAAPLGVAGEALAQGVQKSPEWVDSIRRWMTAKQLGANTTQLKGLLKDLPEGQGVRLDRIEQFMDENGMLDMGSHYANVESKSKEIAEQAGKKLEGLYQNADKIAEKVPSSVAPEVGAKLEATRLHGPDMANEFIAQEAERLKDTKNGDKIIKQLQGELGTSDDPGSLTKMGKDVSMERMWKFRKSVDEDINFARSQGNATLERSYVNLRNFLNDKILGRVSALDGAGGTNMAQDIGRTNQVYSDSALVNKISQNTTAREIAKHVPGLVGTMTGGAYGAYDFNEHHNLPEALAKAAAVGLLTRGARAVAPAMTYRGATALEPYLQRGAQALQKNPQAGSAFAIPWLNMNRGN